MRSRHRPRTGRQNDTPAREPRPAAAPAVLSFLKEMSAAPAWTTKDLARILNISEAEAKSAVLVLQMAGYAQPSGSGGRWVVTEQADAVSGAKDPCFTRAAVDNAIAGLLERVRAVNADPDAGHKVGRLVVFGDYLSGRDRLQAADIGVELESSREVREGAVEHAAEERILKALKARSAALNVRLLEPWMVQRTHRVLF